MSAEYIINALRNAVSVQITYNNVYQSQHVVLE